MSAQITETFYGSIWFYWKDFREMFVFLYNFSCSVNSSWCMIIIHTFTQYSVCSARYCVCHQISTDIDTLWMIYFPQGYETENTLTHNHPRKVKLMISRNNEKSKVNRKWHTVFHIVFRFVLEWTKAPLEWIVVSWRYIPQLETESLLFMLCYANCEIEGFFADIQVIYVIICRCFRRMIFVYIIRKRN